MSKKPDMSDYDYEKTEEFRFQQEALEYYRALSPDEKRQTLVDAGILHPVTFKLTRRYGGDAPNPGEESAE